MRLGTLALACIGVVALLVACGGGGASTAPPPTPETINGIVVPSPPDATTNAATIAGVDTDRNGIRDDVDRLLATNLGLNPQSLTTGQQHARTLQAVLLTPTPQTMEAHDNAFRCVNDGVLMKQLSKVTRATLDTPARQEIYGRTFAGTSLTLDGC